MAELEVAPLRIEGSIKPSATPDFSIHVEGEEIMVNADVLRAKSEYFQCLLNSGMQEVQKASVELIDVNKHIVKTVIDYMYGEDITIEWEDVVKYVDVIEQWQIADLKDHVERYLCNNIEITNCIDLSSVAAQYNMKNVLKEVKGFISSNFVRLSSRSKFLSLDLEDLKRLIPSGVVLNISCDIKLKGCLRWIQHKDEQRKGCIRDLMDHFELVFHGDFIKLLGNFCKDDVTKFKKYESLVLSDTRKSKLGPVNAGYTMVALGADDLVDPRVRQLLKFDFTAETVETIGTVPKLFEEPYACCHVPFGLFAVCWQYQSCVCGLLDIHTFNYLRLPDLPVAMSSVRAVFSWGKVYVLGQCENSLLVYSLDLEAPDRSCRWIHQGSKFQRDPTLSCASQLCEMNNRFYLLCKANELIRFIPNPYGYGCRWLINMVVNSNNANTQLWNASIVVVDDFLYVLGNTTQSNVKYKDWMTSHEVAPSLQERSGQCSAVHLPALNAIVLCGGSRPEIELYDLHIEQWKISKLQMTFKTSIFTMAV